MQKGTSGEREDWNGFESSCLKSKDRVKGKTVIKYVWHQCLQWEINNLIQTLREYVLRRLLAHAHMHLGIESIVEP